MSREHLLSKISLKYMRANEEVVEGESSDAKSTGVNVEVANAVKDVLKGKKYTDKDSGRQISLQPTAEEIQKQLKTSVTSMPNRWRK
jgi:hypothetical protein